MQLIVNGQTDEIPEGITVSTLLEIKGVHGGRIAVMVNDAIIKKDRFAETPLAPGDRVEIIHMVGGG